MHKYRFLYIVLILGLVAILGFSLFIKIFSSNKAEERNLSTASEIAEKAIALDIYSPADNSTISNSKITVKGKTVSNAEVTVNDAEVRADNLGNFSVVLELEEGENFIFILANDESGNFSEKEILLNLKQ